MSQAQVQQAIDELASTHAQTRAAVASDDDVSLRIASAAAALYGRLAAIVESSEDAIFSFGVDGRIESWNPGAERLYGWKASEVAGREWRTLLARDGTEDAIATGHDGAADAAVQGHQTCHVHRSGALIDVSVSLTPLLDGEGVVLGASAIVRDESATRALQERFEAIFQTSADGLVVTDDERRLLAVNPAACVMTGRGDEELLSLRTDDLLYDEALVARASEDFTRARRQGGSRSLHRLRHADGRPVDVEVTLRPDFRPGQHFAIWRDVTDRLAGDRETARRVAQQTAIARVGRRALEGADVTTLLRETLELAAEVLDAQMGGVVEAPLGAGSLRVRAQVGLPALEELILARTDRSPTARALAAGTSIVVPDWSAAQGDRGELPEEAGVQASMYAIIGRRLDPWGVLAVHRSEATPWTADQVEFLESIANVLADAIARSGVEAEMRHRALHDPLTGLPNRDLLVDRLGAALTRAGQEQTHTAVVMLDIDHFALVNETLGHEAGDELLRLVVSRLLSCVRSTDTVARFAGDQFAVLCENLASEEHVRHVAGRVMDAFGEPYPLEDGLHIVAASLGVAYAPGDQLIRPSDLLRDAGAAMARAKALGRSRLEVFDEAMRAATVGRAETERALRVALSRDEVVPFFQPILDVTDRRLTGFEALARWIDPERGIIPPSEFVPVAEERGLIVTLGESILRQACEQLHAWTQVGHVLDMHVNVAARQLADPALPARVAAIVAEAGVEPGRIVLEITETSLMELSHRPLETLEALRAIGVRVVLDDFGTGYSSLSYLQRFPIEGLKIDRSFVGRLTAGDTGESGAGDAIVEAIVRLAAALGLDVVAEGVETEAQLASLRALGCPYAQGYLFAKPLAAADADALLRSLGSDPTFSAA